MTVAAALGRPADPDGTDLVLPSLAALGPALNLFRLHSPVYPPAHDPGAWGHLGRLVLTAAVGVVVLLAPMVALVTLVEQFGNLSTVTQHQQVPHSESGIPTVTHLAPASESAAGQP